MQKFDVPYNREIFKRQESVLILINMTILGALFAVHVGFLFEIGVPSRWLLIILTGRFIVLVIELLWVQKFSEKADSKLIGAHTHFSIWLNITFAFIASIFGGAPDSHYSVLMIIPVITAAYRFNLFKTLGIVAAVIALTILEVRIYFWRKPPIDFGEFFEAATVSLIFLVVGIVVWLLVNSLREEQSKLKLSLEQLKAMQTRLLAEEKMAAIGQLSSAVAHEIRNPVAMISSSLKMAEKQPNDSPIREEMFNIAAEEANRLEILTTDFLTYARAKEPNLKPLNINEILEYMGSLAKARMAEKNLKLEIVCRENPTAEIDAMQIQQALLNLLVNAIDASPEKGKITIGSKNEGETLTLYVENEGEKIDEEIAAKIFEPFFTAKPKGTGLGLSIVQSIARSHGGEIKLAKNDDGKVRFEIEIPNPDEKN
jgi:signal transduction histidine kinase